LSIKTVESHRQRIKRKLNLNTGTQLVQYAVNWFTGREPGGAQHMGGLDAPDHAPDPGPPGLNPASNPLSIKSRRSAPIQGQDQSCRGA